MSVKLIVTSTRPNRSGGGIARAVAPLLSEGAGRRVDIVDLRELSLPFLDEPAQPSAGDYRNASTLQWARIVSSSDAVVFLTPEYNGGFTAAAKNAIDTLYAEWKGKVAGVVGYGWGGAGRAVPQLEQIMRNVGMAVLDGAVPMPFGAHMADDELAHEELVGEHADALRELGRRVGDAIEEQRAAAA